MRLDEARKAAGLTREQLAVKVNVTLNTIANLESGRHEPRIGLAKRIAVAVGVPLDQLEWGKPATQGDTPKAERAA